MWVPATRAIAVLLRSLLLAAMLTTLVPARPAAAGENLGLCEADGGRRVQSDIRDGIDWCFNGSQIEIRNRSAVVLRIRGGLNPKRAAKSWSHGGEEVERESLDPRNLPPGYALTVDIGREQTVLTLVAEGALTSLYQKRQLKVAAYGFVPGAGDALDFVAAANDFIAEIDDATVNYRDCMERASNFLKEAGCKVGFTGNASFAVGRAIVKGVPIINDAPKVVDLLWLVARAALAGDELVGDPLTDLGEFLNERALTIPESPHPTTTVAPANTTTTETPTTTVPPTTIEPPTTKPPTTASEAPDLSCAEGNSPRCDPTSLRLGVLDAIARDDDVLLAQLTMPEALAAIDLDGPYTLVVNGTECSPSGGSANCDLGDPNLAALFTLFMTETPDGWSVSRVEFTHTS